MRGVFFFVVGCLHAEVAAAELIALRYVEDANEKYQQTNLTLEKASTQLTCAQRWAKLDCQFESRFIIQNYTEESETIVLAIDVVSSGFTQPLSILDGQENILREFTFEEHRAFSGLSPTDLIKGASLTVTPSEQKELIVQGEVSMYYSSDSRSVVDRPEETGIPPLLSRHSTLANTAGGLVHFYIPLERRWPVVGEVSLSVQVPQNWRLTENTTRNRYKIKEDKKTKTLSFNDEDTSKGQISLHFFAPSPPFQSGGPIFGIGSEFAVRDPLLFRFGYEAGNVKGLLASLSLETNFHSRVTLAPSLGFALPWGDWTSFYSFSVGLPLEAQLGQPFSAGFRVQADVGAGRIGLSMPVDIFPSQEQRIQPALLIHLSF